MFVFIFSWIFEEGSNFFQLHFQFIIIDHSSAMAQRQISDDSNDFEVLPRHSNKYGDYMSIDSAASGDGDPYEKRRDIVVVSNKLQTLLTFRFCSILVNSQFSYPMLIL